MSGKNIVVCCDGTGNEVTGHLSNVLKTYRVVAKNERQIVYYDPGVGTLESSEPWARVKNRTYGVLGLATGYGLDSNVLSAYRFLVDAYEDGDKLYLFGFSRGAYTARVLAGFLRLVGLLRKQQRNLSGYALTAYKQSAEQDNFKIAWQFSRVISTRRIPIRFIGVWDTVSSVIVPRPDRFYIPSLQELPYTKTNDSVEVFRHALAIDERRRMFVPNIWRDEQVYQPDPFKPDRCQPQDVKQVWFSGVHSDVGGGYREEESGLSKHALLWMLMEAHTQGLILDKRIFDAVVLGRYSFAARDPRIPPDAGAPIHDSMSRGWRILEWLPRRSRGRPSEIGKEHVVRLDGVAGEPRQIQKGATIHHSVQERQQVVPDYRPINIPSIFTIEGPSKALG